MNSRTVRIVKEARMLFWAWLAVIVAAAAKLVVLPVPDYFNRMFGVASGVGFYLGIPLLAALPFGEEFQQRTLSFLVSQPVDRMKIWSEKWIVLAIAVLSAAFVYWRTWQGSLRYGFFVVAVLWAIVSVCSATFWLLVARSTLGGMVLSAVPLIIASLVLNLLQWLFAVDLFPSSPTAIKIVSTAVLVYGALMLWLGRRRFARFEVNDNMTAVDLVVGSRSPIGITLEKFLRCAPSGAIRNLIRKELRILWPIWMLTALALVCVFCLAPFRSTLVGKEPGGFGSGAVFTVLMLGLYTAVTAVLAGSLVMGEERVWGTHLAQLTLPVSVRLQWLVKLSVATLSSTFCVYSVLAFAFALLGQPFLAAYQELFVRTAFIYSIPLIWTPAAFCCACAVKGTLRASLWLIPAAVAVLAPLGLGLFTFRLLLSFGPLGYIQSVLHPYPLANRAFGAWEKYTRGQYAGLFVLAPVLLVVLVESLKLFRRDVGDGVRLFLRYVALPALVAYAAAFVQAVPEAVAVNNHFQTRDVLIEVARAFEKMQLDPSKLDPTTPLQFTLNDLNRISPLSGMANRWLHDASISAIGKRVPHRVFRGRSVETEEFPYFVSVHLKPNWECTVFPGSAPGYYYCTSPSGNWGYVPLR